MICPQCKIEKKKSKLFPQEGMTFLDPETNEEDDEHGGMDWHKRFYDEEGESHIHYTHIDVKIYNCSNGHKIKVFGQGTRKCSACTELKVIPYVHILDPSAD